jgi:hypothetical protein
MSSSFVSPVGYVDLDNDCEYALNVKSTRGRESVVPKEDLAFYFQTYIIPKYGLGNINVSNVASFMKDLEMNWTKLDQGLKGNVLDIMVDGILSKDSAFKSDLLNKLNGGQAANVPVTVPQQDVQSSFVPKSNFVPKSKFVNSKSNFGIGGLNVNQILIILAVIAVIIAFFLMKK